MSHACQLVGFQGARQMAEAGKTGKTGKELPTYRTISGQ